MQSSALFLITVAAATVTANLQPLAGAISKRAIEVRQDDESGEGYDDSDTCESEWESMAAAIPTAPADLQDTLTIDDDGCAIIPASLTSDWDAYTSSLDSWYTAASEELDTFTATCTDYSSAYTYEIVTCVDEAVAESTTPVAGTSAKSTGPTTTGTARISSVSSTVTAKSPSSNTSTANGAAATGIRDAGIVGVVLAGALGAAIAL